jgi:hypothetical protein
MKNSEEAKLSELYQVARGNKSLALHLLGEGDLGEERKGKGNLSADTIVRLHTEHQYVRFGLIDEKEPTKLEVYLGSFFPTLTMVCFLCKFARRQGILKKYPAVNREVMEHCYWDMSYGLITAACLLCRDKPDVLKQIVQTANDSEEFMKLVAIL